MATDEQAQRERGLTQQLSALTREIERLCASASQVDLNFKGFYNLIMNYS